jgi:hypothetical protein
MSRFGADRQNPQCLLAERRQRRHPLEKGDVFFEAHGYCQSPEGGIGQSTNERNASAVQFFHGTSL